MHLKKLIQRMILVVGLFAVCAITVTYAGIRHAKQVSKESSSQNPTPTVVPTTPAKVSITPTLVTPVVEEPPAVLTETGIDLYGTYDENDLLIQTVLESRPDDVEIKIPQINGLKNLEIQEKINQEIYGRVEELLERYPKATYGNYYVRGNFANVLSISYHVGDGSRYEQLYLNYNLVTGEQLTLEDLFLKDADITQCVRRAFYDMLAQEKIYSEDMDWMPETAVSPDENQVYKLVKGYMESEDYQFMFTPSEICFYYKDYVATLRMVDVADQIAVYSRFMTKESIFVRDDIGFKNAFTCADTQNYDSFKRIEYGYLEPNFWYDITIWDGYLDNDFTGEKLEKFENFEVDMYALLEQRVEEYREVARNHPDKFYILFLKPGVDLYFQSDNFSNVAEVKEFVEVFEMPMEVYETTYRDKLIDTYRYIYFVMRGGAYLDYNEGDGAIRQTINESKIYNYITGEELTELDDIFHKYSGYMDVIRSRTWDTLSWRTDYSWAEIDALVDTLQCRLEGTSVYVTIPSMEDFYFRVLFSEFDDNMLKIFD